MAVNSGILFLINSWKNEKGLFINTNSQIANTSKDPTVAQNHGLLTTVEIKRYCKSL